MSKREQLAHEIEVELLAADAKFFFALAKNPYYERMQGHAMLSLVPFLSSFALDSSEYLKSRDIAGAEFLEPHERLLLASRLRMKPLEVHKKSLDEVLSEIDYLIEVGERWFVGNYPRPLKALRKLWQTDVGVQFIRGEVFCTTHVSSLNLGISQEMIDKYFLNFDDLGKFMFDMSTDLGRYTVSLAEALDLSLPEDAEYPVTDSPHLQYSDHFSRKLYQQFADTVSERNAVCVLLTAIISQVNFARIFLPYITVGNELAAFKMRFLSLYHAVSTLDKLMQVQSQRKVLKPAAVEQIKKARSSRTIRTISDYHLLRRALVHYDVQDKKVELLSEEKILHGFVEAHAKGRNLQEVSDEVGEGLAHISHSLGILLPKSLTPEYDFD